MIAILIPVYNDPDGLEMTMQSLREDTVEADIFIVDDGSDPPQEAPEPGVGQRIFLHRLDCNGGITRALNAGLREIVNAGRYEYVARIDAGDLAKPGRFFAQKAFLDANPDHAVVGGWAIMSTSARESCSAEQAADRPRGSGPLSAVAQRHHPSVRDDQDGSPAQRRRL